MASVKPMVGKSPAGTSSILKAGSRAVRVLFRVEGSGCSSGFGVEGLVFGLRAARHGACLVFGGLSG